MVYWTVKKEESFRCMKLLYYREHETIAQLFSARFGSQVWVFWENSIHLLSQTGQTSVCLPVFSVRGDWFCVSWCLPSEVCSYWTVVLGILEEFTSTFIFMKSSCIFDTIEILLTFFIKICCLLSFHNFNRLQNYLAQSILRTWYRWFKIVLMKGPTHFKGR